MWSNVKSLCQKEENGNGGKGKRTKGKMQLLFSETFQTTWQSFELQKNNTYLIQICWLPYSSVQNLRCPNSLAFRIFFKMNEYCDVCVWVIYVWCVRDMIWWRNIATWWYAVRFEVWCDMRGYIISYTALYTVYRISYLIWNMMLYVMIYHIISYIIYHIIYHISFHIIYHHIIYHNFIYHIIYDVTWYIHILYM